MLTIRKRNPSGTPIRFAGGQLGEESIDDALIYQPVGTEPECITADVVTHVGFTGGKLTVEKRRITIPKQGPPSTPPVWVSGVKLVGNDLVVQKAELKQGPDGLTIEYHDEVNPQGGSER